MMTVDHCFLKRPVRELHFPISPDAQLRSIRRETLSSSPSEHPFVRQSFMMVPSLNLKRKEANLEEIRAGPKILC